MSGEPRILEHNWVDAETVFTSSHGGTLGNLLDRDFLTLWTTTGANDDDTTVTLTVEFKQDGVAIARTIDTVLMLNHNLKNVQFEYWDGDSWEFWFAWTDMVNNNSMCPDMRMFIDDWPSVSSITATKIRMLIYGTSPVDAEKYIGELILSNTIVLPGSMASYDVRSRQKIKQVSLGDGGIVQVVQYWTPNRSQKYEATVGFTQVSQANWEILMVLKESGRDFIWYPESDVGAREIYWVIWTNPLPKQYASTYKVAGINVRMEFKEI